MDLLCVASVPSNEVMDLKVFEKPEALENRVLHFKELIFITK